MNYLKLKIRDKKNPLKVLDENKERSIAFAIGHVNVAKRTLKKKEVTDKDIRTAIQNLDVAITLLEEDVL